MGAPGVLPAVRPGAVAVRGRRAGTGCLAVSGCGTRQHVRGVASAWGVATVVDVAVVAAVVVVALWLCDCDCKCLRFSVHFSLLCMRGCVCVFWCRWGQLRCRNVRIKRIRCTATCVVALQPQRRHLSVSIHWMLLLCGVWSLCNGLVMNGRARALTATRRRLARHCRPRSLSVRRARDELCRG